MTCRLVEIPTSSLKSTLESPKLKPPTTKEEAIFQAKNSLFSTLKKPLNNSRLTGKFKKLKQSRYRVEIPVIDDSPSSLSELAIEVFNEIPIEIKGAPIKLLILWHDQELARVANEAFGSHSSIQNLNLSSVVDENKTRVLNSSDFAVFLGPEICELDSLKRVSDILFPKPVVILNPQWSFEEESDVGERLCNFVESFEVVYCFMGLEVRGILSKRKGVILKNGVWSGEKWYVFVEEEEGEMKLVSSFKTRPSIAQVENVLYNVMAINSPIAKSSKFLKDLISNVTGTASK